MMMNTQSQKSIEKNKQIMQNFASNSWALYLSGFDEKKFDIDEYEQRL